jgi:hypothetical protein
MTPPTQKGSLWPPCKLQENRRTEEGIWRVPPNSGLWNYQSNALGPQNRRYTVANARFRREIPPVGMGQIVHLLLTYWLGWLSPPRKTQKNK